MTAITDSEIRQKGLGALVAALGEVNAERFIMLINREPFDYTEWQKNIFPDMTVHELSALAMKARNKE
jgi:hypothetical protein